MRFRLALFATIVGMCLTACSRNETILIGFIGGLSGRVADLSEAGRNGAQLAIEEANTSGSFKDRKIELLSFDDRQQPDLAAKAVREMAATHVAAIIGPMTSAMGEAALPVASETGMVMVSPTITSSELVSKDDQLFSVAPSVSENTRRTAKYVIDKGMRRIAIAYDLSNRAYSYDWLQHFQTDFNNLGGNVVAAESFTSGDDQSYGDIISRLDVTKPDALLFVANAIDTVRLTQIARNRALQQPVIATTWAATESLLQLGGRTVEGIVLTQFFNRDDTSPRYQKFADAYRSHFHQEPGFASVAAYDATNAVLVSLAAGDGKELKTRLLESGPYQGLQETWRFNTAGNALRQTRLTTVSNGHFLVLN